MTTDTKDLINPRRHITVDEIGKAAKDAVLYGSGVLIMDSNFTIRHVPVKEYTELSMALMMAEATTWIDQATETNQPTESKS